VTRIGTVLSLADVALAELAAVPFDFVWLDLEHGALGPADAQAMAIAVQATGASAYARVPHWRSDLVGPLLDAGLDGIVAPRVEDAGAASTFARRLRYAPAGDRGYGPRRAGGYGRSAGFLRSDAARVECIVQVESPAGVEAAEAIAAADGVDAVVVGCADLSLALDVPQDLSAPPLREACDRVAAAARRAGIRFGIAAGGDVEAVAALAGERADMVLYSADVRLYAAAVDATAARLESALAGEAHHG
jgi:2-dehydro-3-deoxyglucarate aldolase/4-hydroxy-2-oxoheptanedioate aldolase